MFAISEVKDLPYLAWPVSVGFNPHPIPSPVILHLDLANRSTISWQILIDAYLCSNLHSCLALFDEFVINSLKCRSEVIISSVPHPLLTTLLATTITHPYGLQAKSYCLPTNRTASAHIPYDLHTYRTASSIVSQENRTATKINRTASYHPPRSYHFAASCTT